MDQCEGVPKIDRCNFTFHQNHDSLLVHEISETYEFRGISQVGANRHGTQFGDGGQPNDYNGRSLRWDITLRPDEVAGVDPSRARDAACCLLVAGRLERQRGSLRCRDPTILLRLSRT